MPTALPGARSSACAKRVFIFQKGLVACRQLALERAPAPAPKGDLLLRRPGGQQQTLVPGKHCARDALKALQKHVMRGSGL